MRPKRPTAGKVKLGITFFRREIWELHRGHKPYQRNFRELHAGQQNYAPSGVSFGFQSGKKGWNRGTV